MVKIPCFHLDSEETAVNAFGVALFVVNACYISAAVSDDTGYLLELSRLVDKLDKQA